MRKRLAIFALSAVAAQAAAGELASPDSRRWEISSGASRFGQASPWMRRNRKDPKNLFVPPGLSEAELIQVILKHPTRRVVCEDVPNALTSYSLIDRGRDKEALEWQSSGCREYLVEAPIGEFTSHNGYAGMVNTLWPPKRAPFGSGRQASYTLSSPGGKQCAVHVYVGVPNVDGAALIHEVMTQHVRNGTKLTTDHGTRMFESTDFMGEGYNASWTSLPDVVVHIYSRGYPADVLRAFARKFPSAIPQDVDCSATAWADRELEMRLEALQGSLEAPNNRLAYRPPEPTFENTLSHLAQKFDIGDLYAAHGREDDRLHDTLVAGDQWRQDYDGYRKELFALRRRTVEKIAAAFGPPKELYFDRGKKLVTAHEPGALPTSGIGAVVLALAVGVALVFIIGAIVARRMSARETSKP